MEISMKKKYVRTSGWRGYTSFVDAIAGANDTGGWSDSPCPSDVCEAELMKAKVTLDNADIEWREKEGESSNVFCLHRYLLVSQADRAEAIALLKPLERTTRLFWVDSA